MLLAVGVLAWSGANIVLGFQTVIERVEESTKKSLFTQLHDGATILGSFGLVIIPIILTNLVFALLPIGRVLAYSEPVVQFWILTVAFSPLYYAPSQAVTSPTGALPGALTAAAGWTVLLTTIQIFAANAARYALFWRPQWDHYHPDEPLSRQHQSHDRGRRQYCDRRDG